MNAAGLILGAAWWRTYQNAFAAAFILCAQAAGLVIWLLAKGERPRWYWAVNVWLLSVLPSYWLGALMRIALYRLPASPFRGLLIIAAPVIPLAIAGGIVTHRTLRKNKEGVRHPGYWVKQKPRQTPRLFWWAFRDSNPGPTGYEPVALTN